MLNENDTNGHAISEVFEHLVKRVLETRHFGINGKPIELNWVKCSGRDKADRFNFSIPYAGEILEWTVLFNSSCPEMGPDFEFNDDSFLADPEVDTVRSDIPSLAQWRSINPESLLDVLGELVQCYKRHQIESLNRFEQKLLAEYTGLIDKADVRPNDVEIILLPDADSPDEARFMIRLDMDFSRLPGRRDRESNDGAMMLVTFHRPNWSRVTPRLYLSKTLERTLGADAGSQPLCIPPFSKDKSIVDYVPDVKKIISDKMNTVVENYEKRNSFIATLLYLQRRNVIEYDATDFTRVTILLEHQDFYFLAHVTFPATFPAEPPLVNLQSIYHLTNKDELVKSQVSQYPYSPRWEPSRMIKSIFEHIIGKEVAKLRNISTNFANRRF